MKIRFAQDKDYAAMARLHRQTIRTVNAKDYPDKTIRVWSGRTNANKFRESASICKRWVGVEDNKVIGFCDHGLEGNGELWGLYIHKDYIGKGVGSRLLKVAEASLKKQGCKKVKIKATITAKEFYKKQGYKVVRKALHKMGEIKVPIYIMMKKI